MESCAVRIWPCPKSGLALALGFQGVTCVTLIRGPLFKVGLATSERPTRDWVGEGLGHTVLPSLVTEKVVGLNHQSRNHRSVVPTPWSPEKAPGSGEPARLVTFGVSCHTLVLKGGMCPAPAGRGQCQLRAWRRPVCAPHASALPCRPWL